jgi:predicted HTH transcriptional regulator
MKEPWQWVEEDLDALVVGGVQESLTLDYKSSASLDPRRPAEDKKRELSKDVSAFANSAGGTLVYGVAEENHLPVAIDTGLDPFEVRREWLEQVINSSIQRRIRSYWDQEESVTLCMSRKVTSLPIWWPIVAITSVSTSSRSAGRSMRLGTLRIGSTAQTSVSKSPSKPLRNLI